MKQSLPDGALAGVDLQLGAAQPAWLLHSLVDLDALALDDAARRCLAEVEIEPPPSWPAGADTVGRALEALLDDDDVQVVQDDRAAGHMRLEVVVGGDADAWAFVAGLWLRLAGAAARVGGQGCMATVGVGAAGHGGAGFLGIAVQPGHVDAHLEPELQDLDPETIHRFVPRGLTLLTIP